MLHKPSIPAETPWFVVRGFRFFCLPSGAIKHGELENPRSEWRFPGKSLISMVHFPWKSTIYGWLSHWNLHILIGFPIYFPAISIGVIGADDTKEMARSAPAANSWVCQNRKRQRCHAASTYWKHSLYNIDLSHTYLSLNMCVYHLCTHKYVYVHIYIYIYI